MYLLAKEISESNLFTNWKGKEGKFVRTFGMNSERNKNEWRATWGSIKKYIHTALDFPGIEYEVCKDNKCDLDHVEADTFEENVTKQKPFERTKIIDYIINEKEESVDLVHEVINDIFWKKLQNKEIKYVSPLIWPLPNGVKVLGRGRAGLPIIDTNAWKFVHHAFLKNAPAYGDNIATVKTMCEGKDCDIKLLQGKLLADTIVANQDNISHLQEIPLLYKHKGQLILLSVSECIQKKILSKKKAGIKITDKELVAIHSECDKSNGKNAKSSFKTCTCDNKHNMSTEEELESKLKASDSKVKELESKLKAQEDKNDDETSHKARKGRYAKLFANIDDEKREKMVASLKANDEDKDELKAAIEVDEEIKKANKGNTDNSENKSMKARLDVLETEKKDTMIVDLKELKSKNGLGAKAVNEYHASLKGKSYDEINSKYEDNKFEINSMRASFIPNQSDSFEWNGGDTVFSLKGKTFDQISEASV